jgi:hypothetical protein
MPFTISSKLSRENQIKYIKCLYESYITMVKEVERDKMKGTPCSWKGKLQIVKMIYRTSIILIKIQLTNLTERTLNFS